MIHDLVRALSALAASLCPATPPGAAAADGVIWAVAPDGPMGAGYMSAVEYGHGLLCTTWAGGALVLVTSDGSCDTVFDPSGQGFESFSAVSVEGGRAAFCARRRDRSEMMVIEAPGTGPVSTGTWSEAGRPCWAAGGLWFAADGWLRLDGEPVIAVDGTPSVSVNPSGTRAAWIGPGDGIATASTGTGEIEEQADGSRFVSLEWINDEVLLASDLEGEIHLLGPGGSEVVARGEEPCWSMQAHGFFYVRTVDDGMSLLGSRLFFRSLSGPEYEIYTGRGASPVHPSPTRTGAVAVDGITGAVIRADFGGTGML